jgi:hypothetical protein
MFAISLLLHFLLTKGDEVMPTDDEFDEVSSQPLPSVADATKNDEVGGSEFYQNLSILGKLHYQLLRSGDISGK